MTRLVKELRRTYNTIEKMMERGNDVRNMRTFYRLIHKYERLNDRYLDLFGCSYNPHSDDRGFSCHDSEVVNAFHPSQIQPRLHD